MDAQFNALGSWLYAHREMWGARPFIEDVVAWEASNAELSSFLRSWSSEDLALYEKTPWLHPRATQQLLDLWEHGLELSALPSLQPSSPQEVQDEGASASASTNTASTPRAPRASQDGDDGVDGAGARVVVGTRDGGDSSSSSKRTGKRGGVGRKKGGGSDPLGIKARKLDQINGFTQCLEIPPNYHRDELSRKRPLAIVDWCCGKGHLGRTIAAKAQVPLLGVEIQAGLCHDGEKLASEAGVEATFATANALKDPVALPEGCMVVALHSCGGLGYAAMQAADASSNARFLVIAPCCHYKMVQAPREPLSVAGRLHNLVLEEHELRLPSITERTPGAKQCRLRRADMLYRTGLDLMLRGVAGQEGYRPFPAAPDSWKGGTFATFVSKMLAREKVENVPADWEAEAATWEEAGRVKLRRIQALASLRQVFVRSIEVWLAFDRAMWLQERGWKVKVGTFCSPEVSPRNILLHCSRPERE